MDRPPGQRARAGRRRPTLLAIVCCPSCPDGIDVREVDEPTAGADEAVVAVHATSMNLGNVRRLGWERDGWRPGYDVAGVVVRPAADGSGPAEGERVAGVLPEGAWAERAAVPTRRLAPVPDAVALEVAAAVPVAGLTSLAALGHGGVLLGKRVLVTGASGGVGSYAIQLARLGGAHVTASVRRPERTTGPTRLGADEVVVGLDREGDAFDLVVESVGGEVLAAALARIAPGGTVVAIGASSDEPTTFDGLAFIRRGGVRLAGIQLFDEMDRQGLGAADLARLLGLVADGRLDPVIERTVERDALGELIGAMRQRRVSGKAVVRMAVPA